MEKPLKNMIKESFEQKVPQDLQSKVIFQIKKQEENKPLISAKVMLISFTSLFVIILSSVLYFKPKAVFQIPLPNFEILKMPMLVVCMVLILKLINDVLIKKTKNV